MKPSCYDRANLLREFGGTKVPPTNYEREADDDHFCRLRGRHNMVLGRDDAGRAVDRDQTDAARAC